MVLGDRFSRELKTRTLATRNTDEIVRNARELLDELDPPPAQLVTDNEQGFVSEEMKRMLDERGIVLRLKEPANTRESL